MARKSKKISAQEADEFIQKYFEQIEGELTAAEFDSLKESYECLKQLVVPGYYSEVATALITTIYSRRKTNKGELVTVNKLINDTINEPLIAQVICGALKEIENDALIAQVLCKTVSDEDVVRLRELNGEDATYVAEETDTESSNKYFVKKVNANK